MASDCFEVSFQAGARIVCGQLFPAAGARRGATVVYIAGPGRSWASSSAIASALVTDGFDVLAFDRHPRAPSRGDLPAYLFDTCTTLVRALDTFGIDRAVLLGASIGAAAALLAAPHDARIQAVIAVTPFAPVGDEPGLESASAELLAAAQEIRVPVLLVDRAERGAPLASSLEPVFEALGGPRELRSMAGVADSGVFRKAWPEIEDWILRLRFARPAEARHP
jgi:pimeloyl-ACP methyl ester carboxylesterase